MLLLEIISFLISVLSASPFNPSLLSPFNYKIKHHGYQLQTVLSLLYLTVLTNWHTGIFPSLTLSTVSASEGAEYSYRGSDCPDLWYRKYPQCGTDDTLLKSRYRQSPIDLSDATFNTSLKPLNLRNYKLPLGRWRVQKFMTGLVVTVEGSLPFVELPQPYEFVQAHFHWGAGGRSLVGSEHSVNGKFYPLEAHIVHQEKKSGQLAVIAIFYEFGEAKNDKDNTKLDPLFDVLESDINGRFYSQSGGTPVLYLKDKFFLQNLLPDGAEDSYYRYIGSLTTPPCSENVIWTVIKKVGHISRRQLYLLERLQQCDPKAKSCYVRTSIGPNSRPTQLRNNRALHYYSTTSAASQKDINLIFYIVVLILLGSSFLPLKFL